MFQVGTPAFAGGVDLLSLLSSTKQRQMLNGAKRVDYRAGAMVFRPGAPRALLLDNGLARIYMSVRDGREATVAFVHHGNMVGARNVLPRTSIHKEPALTFVQAVVDSTFTLFDLDNLRQLAATDIEVVGAIATHLAERVHYDLRLVAVRTLGTVTERLAFDLLDRALKSQLEDGLLEASATHEDLAYSIGSSREVVGQSLKELRSAGVVESTPGKTRILDPVRLTAVVQAFVN